MRSTPGSSRNHKRNMLDIRYVRINCSTLQFCAHDAYIDHMYSIHDKSTCLYSVYKKKRLVFEIQISHNVLNLPDKYNCLHGIIKRVVKQKIFYLWDMTD